MNFLSLEWTFFLIDSRAIRIKTSENLKYLSPPWPDYVTLEFPFAAAKLGIEKWIFKLEEGIC